MTDDEVQMFHVSYHRSPSRRGKPAPGKRPLVVAAKSRLCPLEVVLRSQIPLAVSEAQPSILGGELS